MRERPMNSKLGVFNFTNSADRYSKVDHVSYGIERQETVFRQHLLAQSLTQKGISLNDETEGFMQEKLGENIYHFPPNRNYYDSLDSVEVIRKR